MSTGEDDDPHEDQVGGCRGDGVAGGPDSVCEQQRHSTEQAMNAVLQGTSPFTLTADASGALLTIMSAEGTGGLQFMADPTVGADAFATPTATSSSGG